MKKLLSPARGVLAAALIAGLAMPAQAQLREALNTGEQATRRAEQVQDQINQLDDERTDMVREYRSLLQRRDAADLYAKQQALVVKSQEEEIESLTEQLGSIDDITAQTVPMLLEMIENLKAFVAADLPFKQEERTTRLEGLDAVMETPNVTPAEQYRLIMDAYQAEMEYGRTISTWQEETCSCMGALRSFMLRQTATLLGTTARPVSGKRSRAVMLPISTRRSALHRQKPSKTFCSPRFRSSPSSSRQAPEN